MKASKEDTRPPSSNACLVKSVQYPSFSGNNVDCDNPTTSEIHPSVGGTERRAGSFVVEGVSGFVSVRAMARARVAITTVMCVCGLRSIAAPVDGQSGRMDKVVPPHPTVAPASRPIEDSVSWVSRRLCDKGKKDRKQCNWCCAPSGYQCIRREANRVFTIHTVHNPASAKVSRARAPPRGTCEILIRAQSNGNLIDVVYEGLVERSRQKVTGCLRELIMNDDHEALNMSYLKRNREGHQRVDQAEI